MILLALFVFLLLGIIIPGVLVANIDGAISINFLLVFCIVIWCAFRIVYTGLGGKRRMALLFFYVFIYVFMGVQPLLSVWSGEFPHTELAFPDELVTITIALVMLGTVAFEAGYYRFRRSDKVENLTQSPDRPRGQFTPISISLFWIVICVGSGLVFLSVLLYGPNIFFGLRGAISDNDFNGPEVSQIQGLLVIFGLRGVMATLMFIGLYAWKVRHSSYRVKEFWRLKVAVFFLIILNIAISSPLTAPRFWSGSVLLTSLIISLRWKGPRSFLLWATTSCVALLLLFAGLDPRRIVAPVLLQGEEFTISNALKDIATSYESLAYDANYDAFQMIAYATVYTGQYGYSWGYQLLLPAFFWVPRSVWNSKPVGTPVFIAENAGLWNLNVSSPLWVEGYVNFGIIGLILFLFILGRGARLSDHCLMDTSGRPAFKTIVSAFFAANIIILLRGDLTTGTQYLQLITGLSFLILFIIRQKSRSFTPTL